VRTVASAADATPDGRARARAAALVRDGDAFAAAGDLARALDRYDRASVLRSDDPALDYRIATVLDKQLRPVEALVRYQLFLQRLEIERIGAVGDANAKLADAIARARERVIVLERQAR
jgi:tetratricopeptide (TPR) repeat protein